MAKLDTVLLTRAQSDQTLKNVRTTFKTVHYFPTEEDKTIPDDILSSVEFLITGGGKLHSSIKSLSQLPKLKHVQLLSAGANGMLSTPQFKEYLKEQKEGITLATASGTHVLSIPNYVVGCVIALFHQLHTQIVIAQTKARWSEGDEIDHSGKGVYARKTIGRTAGMLGYGALGRETARLLKAHGMRIVVANTSGKATSDKDTYIIPGTGDVDGTIPDKYFSTKDPQALEAFLGECDVLVASLPDTGATRWLLDAKKLSLLKPDALFVNVGRGSLVKSDDILTALDAKDGLFGAALDVTDPEPLPNGHPLFTHPKCIVTPHLSGDSEGEFDVAVDIAIANAERLREGKKPFNQVDYSKGY